MMKSRRVSYSYSHTCASLIRAQGYDAYATLCICRCSYNVFSFDYFELCREADSLRRQVAHGLRKNMKDAKNDIILVFQMGTL